MLTRFKSRIKRISSRILPISWCSYRFKQRIGYKPNIKRPKTFNEKIQWSKFYYWNPLHTLCADKLAVRDYIMEKGLGNILNSIYGVWSDPKDIPWESLEYPCVLKTNNGSGSIWILNGSDDIDRTDFTEVLKDSLNFKGIIRGTQYHYFDIPPRFFTEPYLSDSQGELFDYKIFCFHGSPFCIKLNFDRENKFLYKF